MRRGVWLFAFLFLKPLWAKNNLVGMDFNFNKLLDGAGSLIGFNISYEFGFVSGRGGIKLSGGVEKGSLAIKDKDKADTDFEAYTLTAMLKYNAPTKLPFRQRWAKTISYYLYILNPWIGVGPAFQINQAIVSKESKNFDPATDYLVELGLGFNISLGLLVKKVKLLREVFITFDLRYSYNLNSLEKFNNIGRPLDPSRPVFSTFEKYLVFRFGASYRI